MPAIYHFYISGMLTFILQKVFIFILAKLIFLSNLPNRFKMPGLALKIVANIFSNSRF